MITLTFWWSRLCLPRQFEPLESTRGQDAVKALSVLLRLSNQNGLHVSVDRAAGKGIISSQPRHGGCGISYWVRGRQISGFIAT
jgi:hypothetical protein